MPTGSSHASLTMAVLVAGGGVYGYIKARSLPSLMAGLTVGALFAGSGYMISQGNAQAGHDLGALSSVALAGAMASRAAKTKKVMPAGMLAALGTVSAAYHIKKSLEWRGWAS